jgi:hypothetical protein
MISSVAALLAALGKMSAGRKKGNARHDSPMARLWRRRAILGLEELESRLTPAAPMAVASFFDSAIYEVDSGTGALLKTLVAPNSSGLLSSPAGLTVGPDNNLYISSQLNNSILEYNLQTNTLSTFISSTVLQAIAPPENAMTGTSGQFAPAGLQFGPDGDLYVVENGGQASGSGGAVIRFDMTVGPTGLAYNGTFATVATGLLQPSSVTFGTNPGDTGNLYVSNSAVGNVIEVTGATTGSPSSSTFITAGSGGMNFPSGLTWGSDGDLYVVDLGATSFQGQVLKFNPNGTFNEVFTQPSSSLEFQFPSTAVFNGQGDLLTANLGPAYPPNLQGSIS